MSQADNVRLGGQLLAGIGQGTDPAEVAALCSVDVRFDIAGGQIVRFQMLEDSFAVPARHDYPEAPCRA